MIAITSFHDDFFGSQQIIHHGVFMFLIHVLKRENVLEHVGATDRKRLVTALVVRARFFEHVNRKTHTLY